MDGLLHALLRGLGETWVGFWRSGTQCAGQYPAEAGYPCLGDTDRANGGRGEAVLTIKVVVPAAVPWREADEAEIRSAHGPVDRVHLSQLLHTSERYPVTLYLNLALRKTL